jgi:hypothetical protein
MDNIDESQVIKCLMVHIKFSEDVKSVKIENFCATREF